MESEVLEVERKTYLVAIPMTEREAETLARTAAARGETIATFLSGVITDIHNGLGDEGDMIQAYLDRSDPPWAEESWVGFCLKSGYDVDTLEYCNRNASICQTAIEELQEILEAGAIPEDSEWEPDATMEDVRQEITFQEEQMRDALEEKETMWKAYKRGIWKGEGGKMTEKAAIEEARDYLARLEEFKQGRITREAKKAIAERARHDTDNSND